MTLKKQFFLSLYEAFNKRDIETILYFMQPDVIWANAIEGGFVEGREAVRQYWLKQFETINPQLEVLNVETDENQRTIVTVHSLIRDHQGNVLIDKTVKHIFTLENDSIAKFEVEL